MADNDSARRDTSDGRHSRRVPGTFPVTWKIRYTNLTGQGIIQNVSADGFCVQLDREFIVHPGALVMTFEAPDLLAAPVEAKIRWFRRLGPRGAASTGFRCGLAFLSAPAERWLQWYRDALSRQAAALDPPLPI